MVPHLFRPVLIVSRADEAVVTRKQTGIRMQVDAGAVFDGNSLSLQPLDERNLAHRPRSRTIERNLAGPAALVEVWLTIEAIQALSAGRVIRLFRQKGDTQQNLRAASLGGW